MALTEIQVAPAAMVLLAAQETMEQPGRLACMAVQAPLA